MTLKTKGPRWDDIHAAGANNIESRPHGGVLRQYHVHGKSRVWIKCPFCSGTVEAYLWSLAGGGKRCACGAITNRSGLFYHWAKGAEPTPQEQTP